MEVIKEELQENLSKLRATSLIEESDPKLLRLENLAIIGSYKVFGTSHRNTELFKAKHPHLFDVYPKSLNSITTGVNQRTLITNAYSELSNLITEFSGNTDWVGKASILKELEYVLFKSKKQNQFKQGLTQAKFQAKHRLIEYIKSTLNITLDPNFIFDVIISPIQVQKRHIMSIFYCVFRYLTLKESNKKEEFVKRVTIICGKPEKNDDLAKDLAKMLNNLASIINNDKSTNKYFKLIYIPEITDKTFNPRSCC